MIAVLCATDMEARPLLDLCGAAEEHDETCRIFSGSAQGMPLFVAVSGVGASAARRACGRLVQQYGATTVVNLGVCGGLEAGLAPGDVYTVDTVVDGDAVLPNAQPLRWPGLDARSLGTVSEPIFGTKRREALARQCALVDMEGMAVADECRRRGVTCMMLKGVSDRACSQGRKDIEKHLDDVSRRLAERFMRDVVQLRLPPDGLLTKLQRFTRIEHTIFSLPLLFAGAWLGAGGGMPSWRVLALIVVVGTGARTFGMAMNRILDRDVDARNPRTAGRELPSGRLSLAGAYAVAVAGVAAYLLGCMGLGRLCLALSPVPLIPLATYALLKRFTVLCHLGIGLCLAIAPLGAFTAASGRLPFEPGVLLLAGFTLFWISGSDIIYGLQDIASDRATGMKSVPAALGPGGAQAVAAASHILSVILLVALWQVTGAGVAAGVALAVAAGAFMAAYVPQVPLAVRFFPISAIAGIAGAFVVLLGKGA